MAYAEARQAGTPWSRASCPGHAERDVQLDSDIDLALREAVPRGSGLVVELDLDDIDDLLGSVSAVANHCEDGKVRPSLDAVSDRLAAILDRFTDEPPVTPATAPVPPKARFTAKQGQYLAFIHSYTKVHRSPPAEADLQRYFRVSAPTVHTMILTLERHGSSTERLARLGRFGFESRQTNYQTCLDVPASRHERAQAGEAVVRGAAPHEQHEADRGLREVITPV